MLFYENKSCPFCKKEFQIDDDIVTCPDCGTPHHRECWNLIGHCVNQNLHKANYSYYEENMKTGISPTSDDEDDNEEIEEMPKFEKDGNPFILDINIPLLDSEFQNDFTTIDGESIMDVAATVRTNTHRFVKKFKKFEITKKKSSWNWGAFFFGAYYFLFRKMYKLGIALFCITISIQCLSTYFTYKFAPTFSIALSSAFSNESSASYTAIQQQMQDAIRNAINASDYGIAQKIFLVTLAVLIVVRIILAIFADYSYKQTVTNIIKSVKSQIENGASFAGSSFMMEQMPNLSQEQMKRMYLSKKGGTTIFAPLLALLIKTFI